MSNTTSLGFTIFARNVAKKAIKSVASDLDTLESRLTRVGQVARKGVGLASLAGGAAALGQALVPAAAAVAALPAAMGVAKVAAGTLKVGLIGVGDAMSAVAEGDTKKLNKALKDLSPNARAFVRETAGLKATFDPVQKAVQNKLFAGLADQMRPAAKNLLPAVRTGMTGVASSLNAGAREALKFAATPLAKGAVGKVFGTTERIMTKLGGAVRPVLGAVTQLTVASLPLAERLAGWASGGAKAAAAFLTSERGIALMRDTVQAAGDKLAQLGRIGKNIATGLVGVFSQANGFGGDLLGTIEKLTGKFAAWAQSAQGQRQAAEVFSLLGDTARQVASVLPIVMGPLGAIAKIMTSLPEPVRGVVTQMLAFGVVAGGLAGKLVPVGRAAVGAGTGLIQFGAGLIKGSAGLGENAGMAAKAGAALRSFGSTMVQGVVTSSQMTASLGQLALAKGKVAAQAALAAGKQALLTGAQIAGNLASKALAAGTWLVNAAMRANPIGLVVTALTLLVGGLVLAYNKSEAFRKIVQGAWAGIQVAASWAWNNVLKPVLGFIVRQFTTVGQAAMWLWQNAIRPAWNFIAGGIRTNWLIIKAIFDKLKTVVLQTIPNAFKTGVAAVKRFWDKLISVAKTPVNFVIKFYNQGVGKLVNQLASWIGIKARLPAISYFARGGTLDNPAPVAPMKTNGPLAIVGEGKRQYPEYVIPTDPAYRSRAQALWAAAGQDLGGTPRKWLTGPHALGGEGMAFARGGVIQTLSIGGIIGKFVQGVKDFTVGNVARGARTLLDKVLGVVPGAGMFRDVIAGIPGWVKDSVVQWIKDKVTGGVGGAPVQRALAWAKAQEGKPYIWGGVGPRGWDCSGFMI